MRTTYYYEPNELFLSKYLERLSKTNIRQIKRNSTFQVGIYWNIRSSLLSWQDHIEK